MLFLQVSHSQSFMYTYINKIRTREKEEEKTVLLCKVQQQCFRRGEKWIRLYGMRKEKKICTVSPLNQHDFVPSPNKRHSRCVLFVSRVFRGIVLDCREVCRITSINWPRVFSPENNIKRFTVKDVFRSKNILWTG